MLVLKLNKDAKYSAKALNPTNGDMSDLGTIALDKQSSWIASKPKSIDSDDWVIIVEQAE